MKIRKRSGSLEELDIAKIQKQTGDATFGLQNVSQSELELDAHLKFVEGMKSSDIQDTLIHTAVEKIDIDRPDWTFVAARLFIYDLYHTVGAKLNTVKGNTYGSLLTYIKHATSIGKMHPIILESYSEEEINILSNMVDPRRDMQFNYLGIKTLADRYLIKNNDGEIIELPQHMFMSIAMFLAQNEKNKVESALEFYDTVSKFEVMLATPTLSNARTNRHQLSSCFIGASPDNIEGIFDGYKEKALMSKLGGGIGWDWNSIRSIGGSIDGFKAAAGGTVPFIKIDNDIALAVDQLGKISAPSYRNVA